MTPPGAVPPIRSSGLVYVSERYGCIVATTVMVSQWSYGVNQNILNTRGRAAVTAVHSA
ncbi:MAG TPA: hypothetical protein VGM32_01015 [Rhodopila sp.]|jgi:hypothetical protein